MFLWFLGLSWLLVYAVFQSPALDYRLVMAGAVVPLLDVVTGGAWVLHSLVGSVLAMGIVVVVTRGRRLVTRRWIGLPIGMFMHLVLDGVWADTDVFWWPFSRASFKGAALPESGRGGVGWAMELAGLAALAWGYRRFGFDDPVNRRRFLSSGQLPR